MQCTICSTQYAVHSMQLHCFHMALTCFAMNWAPSSEFVSSSIPSWQILTAHAQPFRGARDLAFCLKVPLGSLLVWASSGGSGETARMRRLAWTFAARIGGKYQIRLTRPNYWSLSSNLAKPWWGGLAQLVARWTWIERFLLQASSEAPCAVAFSKSPIHSSNCKYRR